jgi:hypothetical protein
MASGVKAFDQQASGFLTAATPLVIVGFRRTSAHDQGDQANFCFLNSLLRRMGRV